MGTLLLFGATGDLSRRMLLPSLYGLDADGLLPAALRITGTARTELDDESFRAKARQALEQFLPAGTFDNAVAERLLARLSYVPLDITDPAAFGRLAEAVGDPAQGVAIFLSTAPSLFKPTIDGLAAAGLARPTVRMALEKPLGSDLASSREINDSVASAFPEERTFRIDHYLGKETVQNLLALRFANSLLEPLWNSAHIDHVRISVSETVGVEGRFDYYDGAGALRDMVQNHMLQLLALVAMEPPTAFDATAVRDEKVKVLRSLRPLTGADSVIGQYVEGTIDADSVPGYAAELGRESDTETFVALKVHVDNWRWSGVPFYLSTGKRLQARGTEIFIQFREVPHSIFAARGATAKPNKLIIGLQPEETIRLLMMAKTPGLDRDGVRLRELPLDLGLANAFTEYRRRIAYERLLLDLIEGDPTLFVRRDEVEAQWAWIDQIRAGWADAGLTPVPYAAGSWGPADAFKVP
ncbi:MAG: glucose-6-phosphate dehydrogenase [Sphingomonas sp.]|nr:glucose-6-phosphate dehydrogenase [Sphingomonas sp.]